MANLLNDIASYLAEENDLVPGTSIFYNEMPENEITTVLVQETFMGGHVLQQINAELHRVRITARGLSSTAAETILRSCYTSLLSESGVIELTANNFATIELQGTPIWEKTDQQGRSFFYFTAVVISSRIN